MALGAPYATPGQLEERTGKSDDRAVELLDAASRAVESFTRRQFNRAEEATARRFRATDRERVVVDDFHSVDGLEVVVNGVTWAADYIDAHPAGTVNGQVGWPFSEIFAVGRSFPWSRRATITVTAKWGWVEVPAAIVQATLDVAEVMSLSMTTGQSGTIRSETMGGYTISYATPTNVTGRADVPQEMAKAVPYRRKSFGVG
jgi:hypothetical protein